MIRSRLPRVLLLAVLSLALALGCSSRKGKVLGNERLLRGEDGLGATTRTLSPPDRDTYVSMGEANFGKTLVVGFDQGFEGRAFFRRPDRWVLPDAGDPSVVVLSLLFELPTDVDARNDGGNLSVTLATTASPYDPDSTWPGLPPAVTIGTADSASAPFRIALPLSVFPLMEQWAADSSSFNGLVLYPTGGSGVAGFEAGKGTIAVVYSHDVGGVTQMDTVRTALPNDHYLHPPRSPAPTGSDGTLVLGGLFELGVPLRFPAMEVPEGSTVNEATVLLYVDASTPLFASGQETSLLVRRIRSPWPETVVDTTMLDVDSLDYAVSDPVAVRSTSDVLAIELPQRIIRQWTAAGAVNEGILITVQNANRFPEIRIGSRESFVPSELRVSITGPPPGRF